MCTTDDCPDYDRRDLLKGSAAFVAAGLMASATGAQTPTADPGTMVKFPTKNGDCGGYLVLPKGTKQAPGVLLMHGEIGVPEGHRLVAQELADAGFCALVIQRFSRSPGFSWEDVRKDNEGPRHLSSESFFREEEEDGLGALEFLRKQPRVRHSKLGAVGFCAGGVMVVRLSLRTSDLGAIVSFYGPPALSPTYKNADPLVPLVDIGTRVHTPLQIHYGTADYIVKGPDVDRFAAEVRSAGTEVEVYPYEGATHAFYDRTNPKAWNAERGKLAHDRYIGFLKKHLA